MTSRSLPVVLDVDTGVDDACALLLAARHPGLDLVAVTCVAGNAGVDDVVANTLTVLEAAGRPDVPVARGAARPLLEPARRRPARPRRGRDGRPRLAARRPRRRPAARRRAAARRAGRGGRGRRGDRITLVPLAPLTNIALLLRT